MPNTHLELPEAFSQGDNYKGKNIISFSSAGRYYVLGSDPIKPLVINGPFEALFEKLKKVGEGVHPDDEKEYLEFLPSSLPTLCRLIQIQFPNIFIHLVRNQYTNGNSKSKIIISGRTFYQHNLDKKNMWYYPANETLSTKRFCRDDDEHLRVTGMRTDEWNEPTMTPVVTRNYRMGNMSKFEEERIEKLTKYREEIMEKGTKVSPDLEKPMQVFCQWINKSIEKVGGLEVEKQTPKPPSKKGPKKPYQNKRRPNKKPTPSKTAT